MTDQVYNILRNQITAGVFRHGEALKLAQLSKKLGVSQTPVREALIRLSEKEYIEKNNSRSYIIKKVSRIQYMRISEIRAKIEAAAIRQIIEENLIGDIDALQSIYDDQCLSMDNGDYENGLILNRNFHGNYLRWTDTPMIADFVENICVIAGPILANLKDRRLTDAKEQHYHAQILNALRARDADKAAQAVHLDIMANAERTCSFMHE